jgi:hypothetical protein
MSKTKLKKRNLLKFETGCEVSGVSLQNRKFTKKMEESCLPEACSSPQSETKTKTLTA